MDTLIQVQGWLTQIGLCAAFGKIVKNLRFGPRFTTKTEERHPKFRKIG
jgi:hypothetical protein